ncbi:hypothetical protein CEXT_620601 [Caerostris extrusa]|uniref:Uncharacterized protein n=1 Tax=Caerostris extrusa TaxID=172846 RepID=A0AAV4QDC9_CAEEX|nr:hypothetical protein CEXT_620601 [Caerostris extrusa]
MSRDTGKGVGVEGCATCRCLESKESDLSIREAISRATGQTRNRWLCPTERHTSYAIGPDDFSMIGFHDHPRQPLIVGG